MSKNNYVALFDSIKTDEKALRRAVDSIYEKEQEVESKSSKHKNVNMSFVPVVAATMTFILILGVFIFPISSKMSNSFVVKAGASEINSIANVEIGELKGENNAMRICFDEANNVSYIAQCKVVSFPVMCTGNNIEKVRYKVNGDGYFALISNVQGVSDVEYIEDIPASYDEEQKYPYVLADMGAYENKALAYTVDYDAQNETIAKLGLYTIDDGGKYCDLYNESIYIEKSDDSFVHGKEFDYEMMYLDIFTDGNYGTDKVNYSDYSIEVTAIFEDGTQESKIVNLGIQQENKTYESDEDGEYTALKVFAKLSE